jgi:EpsI family protein
VRDSIARFVIAAVLISSTAILLHVPASREKFPPRLELASFPTQLGDWDGSDVAIDKDTLQVLGPGDFLLRVYATSEPQSPNIALFIAYFPSQRAGDTIHSPKNCLPGAGWEPVEAKRITLSVPGHRAFRANQYLIARGDSRQLVLYWYWAHDRGVASEYWAKYYLVADSIKMNRSDGALVRLSTPLLPGETADVAERRLVPFVADVVPRLQSYIPR